MADQETFCAAFPGGISVAIKIDFTILKKSGGSVNCFDTKWEGQPTPQIIPQYIAWMHTVMSGVAKRVNKPIGYVYPGTRSLKSQNFIYFPDGRYEEME